MPNFIGRDIDQVPTNGMLGTTAFLDVQDLPGIRVFDFDSVTSQVLFTLPTGYVVKAVFVAGVLKRSIAGAAGYVTTYPDLVPTITMGTSPGVAWVSVLAELSN